MAREPKLEVVVDLSGPQVTVATIQAALDSVRRIIVCHVDVEAGLREAVEKEGLSNVVEIIGTSYLEPRTAYVVHKSNFMLDVLKAAEENRPEKMGRGAARWLLEHDAARRS